MNAPTGKIEASLVSVLAQVLPTLGAVHKNKKNPAFKSNYADLSAVLTTLAPISEHGLWFRQVPVQIDGGVGIETFYVHESGEEMSAGITPVPVNKNDAQGLGSAMSYGRRYGLMTAFGLSADDDDGTAAARSQVSGRDNTGDRQSSPPGTAQAPTAMPAAEFAKLVQLIEATSTDRSKMLAHFKVKDLRFLNQAQYGEAVEKLTADLAAMAKQGTNKAAGFGEILNDEIAY